MGDVTAAAILDWMSQQKNKELLSLLRAAGVVCISGMHPVTSLQPAVVPELLLDPTVDTAVMGDENQKDVQTSVLKVKGLTIAVSGSISGLSRTEFKKLIEASGGTLSSTISQKTCVLVLGSEPGVKKQEKAKELNITVLSEEEFWKRFS